MLCPALAVIEEEIAGMKPLHDDRWTLLAYRLVWGVRISRLVDAVNARSAAVVS